MTIILSLLNIASASQIKEASGDDEIHGTISLNELNRIKLIGDEIATIKKKEGGFTILPSNEVGEVYLRVTDSNILNFFIESKKGYTYNLLLRAKEIPSEQIFIKNPEISLVANSTRVKLSPYKQEIVKFYKELKNATIKHSILDFFNKKYEFAGNNELNSKIKINLIHQNQGNIYEGEIYELSNISKENISLKEDIFKKKRVRALSFEKLEIAPGEKTKLYVILERT
jgi:conjugal transfer pilus assembly protein TraK